MNDNTSCDLISTLLTEQRSRKTIDLDCASSLQIVQWLNEEDHTVAEVVKTQLPTIARIVDIVVEAFKNEGRLIYVGAGSSGRLGVIDAAEMRPTFGVNDNKVLGIMAGGKDAMFVAVEGAEDDPEQGVSDLRQIQLNALDVVVGIAASGRTPYVQGALQYANEKGCHTVALTCNPSSVLASIARSAITTAVGPEVLTGSTRLKSATAHKMVLNMLSTASMVRIGKCYQNLMVDMSASNEKLRARAINIVCEATTCDVLHATDALRQTQWHVKPAIVMLLLGVNAEEAQRRLNHHAGFLRKALA
jgi:N-acetylmuramic acid 6-phosphate etherase